MARMVVVGSINMDLVVRTPRLPRLGETLLGGEFATAGGGKGANQAVACSRLGADVSMVGCVGTDYFGTTLLHNIRDAGVNCFYIRQKPEVSTGVAVISVVKKGDNAIIVSPGANALVSAEQVRGAREAFLSADVALFQQEIPAGAVEEGLRLAKECGVRTVLDPAPFRPISEEVLSLVDVLIPNDLELRQLGGSGDLAAAARALVERGMEAVIITAGEDGAFVFTENVHRQILPPKVVVTDTTAAGDAFAAGLAVSLAEDRSIEDACRFGVCAGALACTKMGAQPSLPARRAVERLCVTLQ